MSCHTKDQLENMLEDVVNELELSSSAIERHGQLGTPPAELVREVLHDKDKRIAELEKECGAQRRRMTVLEQQLRLCNIDQINAEAEVERLKDIGENVKVSDFLDLGAENAELKAEVARLREENRELRNRAETAETIVYRCVEPETIREVCPHDGEDALKAADYLEKVLKADY